ncbi:sensor domain-containing diguanylate cyclase [Clostridium uliginosum]|uniref:Diguanylate cyclase (GGDEF) domain-containing protein n=1 Tax=Clostridium uliginosum TaxID=119641 RepID=A0A1I1NW03_9CLOT|nr:GGDEF domain-containing protein [Clostridium uliginosum]SFD01566.1 diguanylate cyclase (GGDEF) domain-containing protein [Clostridium uliginosum]
MKQYGFIYDNFEKMQSFIYSKNINKNENVLIQVFTGVVEIGFIKSIIDELLFILPQAEIVGTTTAGEIYKENTLNNSTIISFTIFEKTKIKSKLLNNNNNDNEYKLGINIVEELVENDTKVIILFADGLLTNSWNIIKGIQSANSNIIVCGGKAGDNGYLKETFVFTKEGITKNGIAAVSLTGKQLNVITDYSFGWSPIGKLMTITKASKNKIYTIDNVKAVDIYKKYLGAEVAKQLPMSATEFPLITRKNGVEMAKVAYSCNDDGSLNFLSNVEVNDKVQFGYGNVNILINNSLEIANRLKRRNVEAIFIYSCSARKSFMQDKINLEMNHLNNVASTFGFFTYGEFFTINNSYKLLNVTMTILALYEGKQNLNNSELILTKNESPTKSFFEGKDLGVIKVFTNLVNQATKELQQTNEMLESQKYKLEQMNDITKSILQINSEMISSGEFDVLIQRILDKVFDIIPNAKMGSILIEKNNKLYYKATKGYNLDTIKGITYNFKDTYKCNLNSIEELFNPKIFTNLEKNLFHKEAKYNSWKNLVYETPRELLTCGIGIDGEVLGFINIYNTNKDMDFSEGDKILLKYICYDIAIAFKNFKLLENILYMSRYDSLTGLYNRHSFKEILSKSLDKAKLSKEIFVICMIDLNDLKIINDTYGHDAGDKILKKFTNTLKIETGKNDILGRIGGDEFIGLFINKNKNEVMEIMSKICIVLENSPLDFNGDKKYIKFAYGLSEFPNDSDDINELLKLADKRMYEKKRIMKENQK